MTGRTWKNIKNIEEIKNYLLSIGGKEEEGKQYELFRIRFPFSVFTFYKNGTLYSTPSSSEEIIKIWKKIDSILGGRFTPPTEDFLIGLDETGKGEVIGPLILAGVCFKRELFEKIDYIVGSSDTKEKHNIEYWEEILRKLEILKKEGLYFEYLEISPNEIDKYNINHLLDEGYKKILEKVLKNMDAKKVRIVIDDYGVGKVLRDFLNNLSSEVIITSNSEEKYLETKTASLIAKVIREKKMEEIRRDEKYQIDGITVGSGNLEDKKTKEWLLRWLRKKKEFPPFVRRSFMENERIYKTKNSS